MEKRQVSGRMGTVVTVLLFVMMLAVLAFATTQLATAASEEGVNATRAAIERAAVLCYSTEGFYPPGLAYIEEHYGVQIDRTKYAVDYSIFSYNIAPSIKVVIRGGAA